MWGGGEAVVIFWLGICYCQFYVLSNSRFKPGIWGVQDNIVFWGHHNAVGVVLSFVEYDNMEYDNMEYDNVEYFCWQTFVNCKKFKN
jgi:hypothetical protein